MRSYMLDEISPPDMDKIRGFLKRKALASSLENIYWQEIPVGLYNRTQTAHKGCAPYVFAIETGRDWIKFELFVRSREGLRCHCQSYCTPEQKGFILDFADQMLEVCTVST